MFRVVIPMFWRAAIRSSSLSASSDILRQNLTGHELAVNGHNATPQDRKHLVNTPTKPHGYCMRGCFSVVPHATAQRVLFRRG